MRVNRVLGMMHYIRYTEDLKMRYLTSVKARMRLIIAVIVVNGLVAQAITDPTILSKSTATSPSNITEEGTDAYALQENQQTLADNQTKLMINQYDLSLNQSYINSNIEEWIGSAVTQTQMKDLLLDGALYNDGYQNLVDQLQQIMQSTGDVLPSLYQEQAVNLFRR